MNSLQVKLDDETFHVELDRLPDDGSEVIVRVNGEAVRVRVPAAQANGTAPTWIVINDRPYELSFDREQGLVRLMGQWHQVQVRALDAGVVRPTSGDGRVKAPIPGQITRILARVGQKVEAGQPLLILEAMKMENQIRAPRSGTLSTLNVSEGQGAVLNQVLAEIT